MFDPKLNAWLKGAVGAAALAVVLLSAPVRAQDAAGEQTPAVAVHAPEAAAPEAAASEHHDDAQAAEKGGLPQLDTKTFASQLFWLLLSFGGLFILMSKVALPRVGGVIEARTAKISGDLDRAGQAKAQTESIIAEYEKALTEARQTATKAIAQTKVEADGEAARRVAELAAVLAERQAKAEEEIAAAKTAALSNVAAVAAEAAAAAVAKLSGVTVSEEQASGAVDGALKERA